MKKNKLSILVSMMIAMILCVSCTNGEKGAENPVEERITTTAKEKSAMSPTVCLYTLGTVSPMLKDAMIDSLKHHYPRVRFEKNLPLPKEAITKKRNDHRRYLSNALNEYLSQFRTDSTIVVGLTSEDIGKDNFRGRPHSGIMGEAKAINVPVAVFSSYRPKDNTQLFRVIIHEIGHTQGLRHCHDTNCIMRNANGGNLFGRVDHFCTKCKNHMMKRGWIL